jgi:hypothetical protein
MNPVLSFFLGLAVIPILVVAWCLWLYWGLGKDGKVWPK